MRKPIPGFDRYEADENGAIWMVRGLKRHFMPHQLRPVVRAHGYATVRVFRGTTGVTRTVHSLVAPAFHGARPAGAEVRHLNGDRLDNRPSNLQWGTSKENTADAIRHGSLVIPPPRRGTAHALAKLDEERVRRIRQLRASGCTWQALSTRFDVSITLCRKIVSRKAWAHVV